MAEITSGTVNATPLADLWIGTLELPATVDDGDTVNLDSLIGSKIKEVTYAKGIRNSSESGSVDISPISWTTGTATLTFGKSGTHLSLKAGSGTIDIDSGRSSLSNYRRDVFFVAKSQR